MVVVTFEEVTCRGLAETKDKYRLVLFASENRKGELRSAYRPGIDVFGWKPPFKDPVAFGDSNSPLRISIELRKKGWLGMSGRTVCSYIFEVDRDCQSATFNLRANESGTPSSPELSVTLTVAGLTRASEDAAQGIRNAPVVTISGPDNAETIPSGPSSNPPDSHVADGLHDNRFTASPHSPLQPAARGANNQLLSQALAESNDAMRSQSSLDLRAPSIAESNTEAAGPTAEAAARITWSGVSRIGAVMELVNVAADIHPLVKGVWSLLNVAYVLAKQQSDLDTNVERLVYALDANCELAKDLAENQITGIAETIVGNILKEVLKGASVIKEYCVIRKSKASLFKFVGSPTASQVDACIETLELLRQDLSAHLAAGTQRDFQTLASTMNTRFDRIDDYLQTKEDEALLSQMPYAPEADRDLRSRERGCLPQTRVEIIDAIINWAIGAELDSSTSYIPGLKPHSRILWLCGVAGSGKSSIAISVARALRSMDWLGALYGFERAFQTTLNPTNLFSSIARQRADRHPEQKRRLLHTLQQMKPEMRATVDAGEQFKSFLATTLAEETSAADDVIVIDAFDESGSVSKRAAALLVLSPDTHTPTFPSNVRFVVTSRYDPDIAERLDSALQCDLSIISVLQMEDIRASDTVRDIEIYVIRMLGNVRGLETARAAGDLARLAVTAEHSFQWASTSCRYIVDADDHDGARLPAERLQETLDTRGGLDELYLSILNQSFRLSITNTKSDGTRSLCMILGCLVCASEPLTVQTIAALASADPSFRKVEETGFHILARKLSSIITGTKDTTTPLVAFHTSFTDFLADVKRSEHYAVDTSEMHLRLALTCLATMKKQLRFNICHFPTSFLRNDEVADLALRVKGNISSDLSYACQFWPVHVAAALTPASVENDLLRKSFTEFLKDKLLLLQWLEVMSLTGTHAYESLSPLALEQTDSSDLSDLLLFITYFSVPIRLSVSHIYLSALAFTPSASMIAPTKTQFPNLVYPDHTLPSWPQVRHKLEHPSAVQSIAWSPDGRLLMAGESGGAICLWDVHLGRLVLPRVTTTSGVLSIAVSRDGKLLASGHVNGTVQLWDAHTLAAKGSPLKVHSNLVRSVAFSPTGSLLASGSDDKIIALWDAVSHSMIGDLLESHSGCVNSVAFSPDGALLLSGSDDRTARLWNVRTHSTMGDPLKGHTDWVRCVSFSPDGSLLASGSDDKTIRLWDVRSGSAVSELLAGHNGAVCSVAFSPDGQTLASCSEDKTVRRWDVRTRLPVGEPLTGHTGKVNSVAFSPDGTLLASGSSDKTVHLWDARNVSSNRESPATQFKVQSLAAFLRDGKLLASGSDGNAIQLWDVHSVLPVGEPLRGHTGYIRCVAFSPDGTLLASGCDDQTIRLWDARTGSAFGELGGHSNWVWALAFSPDSKLLASASWDQTIRLWDANARSASGNPLTGHSQSVVSLAFSPDGDTLASGDYGGTVRLWDVQTRSQIGQALEGHSNWVRCVAFSPDGTLLASGSSDFTIRLWDVTTHSAVGEPPKGHTGSVTSLVFSPNGALLASSSQSQRNVQIWDVRVPSEVGEPVALLRHESDVYSIAFLSAAPVLASITGGGVVRKWDLQYLLSTQTLNVYSPEGHPKKHSSLMLPDHPSLSGLPPDFLVVLDNGWVVGPKKELVL